MVFRCNLLLSTPPHQIDPKHLVIGPAIVSQLMWNNFKKFSWAEWEKFWI